MRRLRDILLIISHLLHHRDGTIYSCTLTDNHKTRKWLSLGLVSFLFTACYECDECCLRSGFNYYYTTT